jgi:hypothetical protein
MCGGGEVEFVKYRERRCKCEEIEKREGRM